LNFSGSVNFYPFFTITFGCVNKFNAQNTIIMGFLTK
jgi:hypothetical protein